MVMFSFAFSFILGGGGVVLLALLSCLDMHLDWSLIYWLNLISFSSQIAFLAIN